jgi:hypothetical protein
VKTATYLKLCGGLALVWILALVFITPFAQVVEQVMLLFLSSTAR